jgi:hypothetical protein
MENKEKQTKIDNAFREYQIECKLAAINLLNKLEKIK